MAIDNLIVRNSDRNVIGIVDAAQSIIWHSRYYGVGEFEIYISATDENILLLSEGHYVTRIDNDEIGLIEKVEITFDVLYGRMLTATGRFAKSILDRRLIYRLNGKTNYATVVRGRVENAVRTLVQNNIINCTWDTNRNISFFKLGANANLPETIIDDSGNAADKQVSYQNLLEYTDGVLEEYGLSSRVILNDDTKNLEYVVFKGADRSIDNTDGNEPVIFSSEYDNLNDSTYVYSTQNLKTATLIGGEGEATDRFYALIAGNKTGFQRREVFVDASSLNKALNADELQNLYPTGVFTGLNFVLDGVVIATLVVDLEREYTLANLQEKFPSGVISGSNFVVSGVNYANLIYGETAKYHLTPLGYKGMLAAEDQQGNYEITDTHYSNMLKAQGKQKLAIMTVEETFNGTIETTYSQFVVNRDFFLGDLVTVQDNNIGKYINSRICEIIEVSDENGYTVEVVYK